jgi:hypothetical protein
LGITRKLPIGTPSASAANTCAAGDTAMRAARRRLRIRPTGAASRYSRSLSDHEWKVATSGRGPNATAAADTSGDSGSCTCVTSGANRRSRRTTRAPAVGPIATGATDRLYGRGTGRPTSTTRGASTAGGRPRRCGANTATS